jgi:hypothetical protein
MRGDANENDINSFFRNQFNIELEQLKFNYTNIDKASACNSIGQDVIISGDKLILIKGGVIFHQYTRTLTSIAYNADKSLVDLGGLKPSSLPFDLTNFFLNCPKHMKLLKGVPQPTDKCGPTYYPYVATRRSTDWLSKLVGSYAYQENKVPFAQYSYDNPVANGFHPIFFVLPPMNDVIVVRVEDMEFSEDRDLMSGTYLSIKNKKVVDILSESCSFDVSYTCSDDNPNRKFQLQPDGRFKRIQ